MFVGLFRLLLAFSVIATHLGFEFGFGGRNSVQIFFLISGYLMSYIIVEKKSYSSNLKFWTSRALRIFPAYWLVLLVTICLIAVGVASEPIGYISALPLDAQIIAIFANSALFFQDIVLFLGVNDGGAIVFAPTFDSTPNPLHLSLIVPQSWSLALELSFYLIAPFVIKRKWALLSILGLSQVLRLIIILLGVGTSDPWTYRFFPVEIGTFLIGAFIHQYLAPRLFKLKGYSSEKFATWLNITLVCLLVVLPQVENNMARFAVLLGICAIGLPALFQQQSNSKFDNALGKLSYPVYLWHVLVIAFITTHISRVEVASLPIMFTVTCAISVLLSLATVHTLDQNVEKLRKRFRNTNSS